MDEANKSMKWVTFSSGWDGCPIAYHIDQEGNKSYLAQVQTKKELGMDDKEKGEDKEQRLAQYEGMMKKYSARELTTALKKIKDKDNYFIFCDQNNLYKYAEELLAAGFTKGLFPTKADYDFEKNREDAMKFVKDWYPDVQIIQHQKYGTVEEAKAAVDEADYPLVIQSEGDYVPTICPVDDVEMNHAEIHAALDRHKADYAKGEIILKEKLVQPIEITPQIVFWDGVPVFTDVDIETKNIGTGENNGPQVGCGTNLIIKTNFDDEINRIAFPEKVHLMAKERKGIFVWDISLYFTDRGIFFGEFCSNRFGYDSLMTEMTMAHGPTNYFTKIMNGENPLEHFTFGTSVRVFNLNRTPDQEIIVGNWKPTWLYESRMKGGKIKSVGNGWDLGVITGRGNTVEEAVDNVYDNLDKFSFKEKYARTKHDFLADYPTSIVHRFKSVNHKLFDAPDMDDENLDEQAKHLKSIEETVKGGLASISQLHDTVKDMTSTKKKLSQKIKERLYGQT
jgi:hypothetical protein